MARLEEHRDWSELQIGSHESIIIEKLFGPQCFDRLRIRAEPSTNEWVIERDLGDEFVEWVRIPGRLQNWFNHEEA